MMEKYGVENKEDLIRQELESVRERLKTKTASKTLPEEIDYLEQREKDLVEALESTKQSLS